MAAAEAKKHWIEIFKELTGKEPPPTAPGNISPLLLHIDDRPSFVKNEFSRTVLYLQRTMNLG